MENDLEKLRKALEERRRLDPEAPESVALQMGKVSFGPEISKTPWTPKPSPKYKEIMVTEANYVLVYLDYETNKWSAKKFYSQEEAAPFFGYYESAILVSVKYDEIIDMKGVRRE
jgi:hypothetical protein